MLLQLDIHNIALIDDLSIEPGHGLNILTGETGAGKSVVVDSINAILGERLSKDMIRTGRDKALVEALFKIDMARFSDIFSEYGIECEEDDTLVVSREFSANGRNVCRVNGKMITASVLKLIGERLVDIHGQHDNQSLLRVESHMELLDSFGGDDIRELKKQYESRLDIYRQTVKRLRELSGDRGERERRIDMLKFQIDEIGKAKLKPGEEEELCRRKLMLSNSEKIITALSTTYELLCTGNNIRSSASDNIEEAATVLSDIAKFSDSYAGIAARLQDIGYQLEDVIEETRKGREAVEYDPEALEQIEERLDLIYGLKRKYGSTVEDVTAFAAGCRSELDELVQSAETVEKLRVELKLQEEELERAAVRLHGSRAAAAGVLEKSIGKVLDELEMQKTRFKVEIVQNTAEPGSADMKFGKNGFDRVEFLISTNIGEPLKPLSKIASGGEMARVMLAIKTILADVDSIPVLIFDEIDSGISGKAAQRVGEKLALVSKDHQVICVTHLTQIACMADNHFLVVKESDQTNTWTGIRRLSDKERELEIARLLGGDEKSEITIRHAGELLRKSRELKISI